jgi:hypothetical protein
MRSCGKRKVRWAKPVLSLTKDKACPPFLHGCNNDNRTIHELLEPFLLCEGLKQSGESSGGINVDTLCFALRIGYLTNIAATSFVTQYVVPFAVTSAA